MKRPVTILVAGSIVLGLLPGCDSKPPTDAPKSSSGTVAAGGAASAPSASDLAAMKSFVNEKTGGGPSPIAGGARDASGLSAAAGALPAGHPPVGGSASKVVFDAPAQWTSQPPKSAMRKAQYVLPKADGDKADGELVVFFFGPGEGGGVKDNIERWKGQFVASDGSPLPAGAAREEQLSAGGMAITLLDVAGKFAPGAMPGAPSSGPQDNFRMIAAVIEAPGGAWFVKAVGPAATMAAQEEAIRKFVLSARR